MFARPEKLSTTKFDGKQPRRSGAEEDVFALEHFYGEEERDGGINAGGEKNQGDEVPVVGAGDEFLAEQAGVENGNQGELGGELDPGKHGGDGGNDDQEGQRRNIALRFLVAFGKKSEWS